MCDVLVIEDDLVVRSLVVEILRENNLSVLGATSLDEARVALARAGCCKVVVVDHDLGEPAPANGFDFARECLNRDENLGVVYISGRSRHFLALPLTSRERQLLKPFTLGEMLSAVQDLMAS